MSNTSEPLMQPGRHHEDSSLPPAYRTIGTGPPEYGLPPTYVSSLEHYWYYDGSRLIIRYYDSTTEVCIMPVEMGLLKIGAQIRVAVRVRPPKPPLGLWATPRWFTRRYVKPKYVAVKLENVTSEGRWKGPEPVWTREDAVDHFFAVRLHRPRRDGEAA